MNPDPLESAPTPSKGGIHRFSGWVGRAGRLEVAILLAILLTVAGMWAFGTIAAEMLEGDTSKFDTRILLALRQPGNTAVPIGPHWTLQVARDLTAFGSAVGLGLITVIVVGYLGLRRRFGFLWFILSSVVTGTLLSELLKYAFDRPRPQVVPHLTDIASASFPSGHSMMSSVVYLTLAALLSRTVHDTKTKLFFFVVAIFLTSLIGLSRLYLGVHFPTDVLAGWCLGCAWAALCCVTAHFVAKRRSFPRVEELSE